MVDVGSRGGEKQDINFVLRITFVNVYRPFYSSYNIIITFSRSSHIHVRDFQSLAYLSFIPPPPTKWSHFSSDLHESQNRVQGRLGAAAPHLCPPRGDANDCLYFFCRHGHTSVLKAAVIACIEDVRWTASNRLQLNPRKREFLWCITTCRLHLIDSGVFSLGGGHISASTSVRDLGVYFDRDMSMTTHVNHLVSRQQFILPATFSAHHDSHHTHQ